MIVQSHYYLCVYAIFIFFKKGVLIDSEFPPLNGLSSGDHAIYAWLQGEEEEEEELIGNHGLRASKKEKKEKKKFVNIKTNTNTNMPSAEEKKDHNNDIHYLGAEEEGYDVDVKVGVCRTKNITLGSFISKFVIA